MTRKKIKLAYIADANIRRATFRKRRNGLLKKVSQLSTLCDVSACAVVYGPYEPQPEIWPAKPEAHRVLTRFKNLPKMLGNTEKQLNRESYARNRIDKINEQWKNYQRENRYIEINWIYNHALAGECSIPDAYPDSVDFSWFLGEKQKEIQRKLANLDNAPAPVVRTIPAANATAIFATSNGRYANTIAIPSNPNNNFINTDVDVLEINGSGINDGAVTGGDM
ncbi:agamous-like MADS-box protein AGL80 [Papaver somniferum]|uniref:agamous-like MADS-box protein AGL80 n=1 Tax=Papaver somniferum TaxID=3469 RepID=UPI000E6FADD0|nr:agamous-like MADS-box protein AGL80 [Papaver somniferum]